MGARSGTAVEIPYYNIGDYYVREYTIAYNYTTADGETGAGNYTETCHIDIVGIGEYPYRFGDIHDCLLVKKQYVSVDEDGKEWGANITYPIDLATKKGLVSVGFMWGYIAQGKGWLGPTLSPTGLGKEWTFVESWDEGYCYSTNPRPFFASGLQGETLDGGDTLIHRFNLTHKGETFNYTYYFNVTGTEEISGENCLVVEREFISDNPYYNTIKTPVTKMWITEGCPEPVKTLTHKYDSGDWGEYNRTTTSTLIQKQRGEDKVPFGHCSCADHFLERMPGVKFEIFERIPVSGETELLYDLNEAVSEIESDITIGFSGWIESHPEAYLLSADYARDGNDFIWDMTFVCPDTDDNYFIKSERSYFDTDVYMTSNEEYEPTMRVSSYRPLTLEETYRLSICSLDDALKTFRLIRPDTDVNWASYSVGAIDIGNGDADIFASVAFGELTRDRDTDLPVYSAYSEAAIGSGVDLTDCGVIGINTAISARGEGRGMGGVFFDIDPPGWTTTFVPYLRESYSNSSVTFSANPIVPRFPPQSTVAKPDA